MIDEEDSAREGVVVHVVVDHGVIGRRSRDAAARIAQERADPVSPMASGSLASWIPPLPLPVTVLLRTNEYELPSTLIPLPGLLGSARPLFSTVLPWIKAWSPATSMPSPVAPTTVKPLIVTQGLTTVKPLLAFRRGVNGEASDARERPWPLNPRWSAAC